MRKSLRIVARFILLAGIGLIAAQANAQLKVGSNPTNIQKSAILELESKKQGLLLPRLDDFNAINGLGVTIPDGMMVYKNQAADGAAGLYIRRAGAWILIASASDAANNWSLSGNNGKAGDFLGTKDNFPVELRTNNLPRLTITAAGNLQAGSNVVPVAANTELNVLVLATDGTISQRKLDANAFGKVVSTLNGLDGSVTLNLTGDAATTAITNTTDVTNPANKKLNVTVPIMSTTTQQYGFLSQADWSRLQATQKQIVVDAFATASAPNGLTIDNTGTQAKLQLHPADDVNPGGVSTTAQTFGGDKTFKGKIIGTGGLDVSNGATIASGLTVSTGDANFKGNTITELNSTVNGKIFAKGLAASTTDKTVLIQVPVTGEIMTRTLTDAAFTGAITKINSLTGPEVKLLTGNAGNDFNIVTDGTKTVNEITLNIPNAAVSVQRGLVTNTAQSFAGVKKFGDSLYTAKALHVGDSSNAANSTLQVGSAGSGTVSMPILTVNDANASTVSLDDAYTVLVKSNNPINLSLPKADKREGRIITIKKIPVNVATDDNLDNAVSIGVVAGDNIEGGNAYKITNDWTFITVQSDGKSGWYIIKK
ncbi:hypothetical protein [Chitinophaga sp. 212800010-3]|uniref:hypothetical protein n=1 Tax=unclassified Chitinophaga TaxID=2619133 RepID=UPI002DE603B1|nr:Peptidase S74 domain-containing protein [Chitinophaga sp. 212800010-3]